MAVSTAPRHAGTPRKRHRVLWTVLTIIAVLFAGTATALFLAYRHLEGNIASRDVSHELGDDRPAAAPIPAGAKRSERPLNILVMGSRVIGIELARELVRNFLGAVFTNEERHRRRLEKVKEIEVRYGRVEKS